MQTKYVMLGIFGPSGLFAYYGILVVGQSVACVLTVDGGREASDENGFPDAPSVIVGLPG